MHDLAVRTLEGDVLGPRDRVSVRVFGRAHPLSGARLACEVEAGLSIAEILDRCAGGFAGGYVVYVDRDPVPDGWHARVRVRPGATVTFFPRLQGGGGGSDVWKSVLGIALVLGALVAAPYLAPVGFTLAGISFTAATAQALVAGGIVLAGTLALNALFPARPAAVQDGGGSLNSIQGAQNQANPFGAIPVVLGAHRQSPMLAAKQYTETIGDDQYLRVVFCCGYGPLSIGQLKIGETPLANFQDVQTEIRNGFPGDAALTLYPGAVDEQPLAITIENAIDGPSINGGNGPWSDSVVTAADTDEISIDFTAPAGINAKDPHGDDVTWPVTAGIRYRLLGAGAWSAEIRLTFQRSFKPTRLGTTFGVARGQYEVQTHKVTGAGNPQYTADTIIWTALRSFKNVAPIKFAKPLALVALRIRATDQLSGAIATFNCVNESYLTGYTGAGDAWSANALSRNPADLFRLVLQGPANARPRTDDEIDLPSLQGFWAYCLAKGFTFDQVITSAGSVFDKLCDIAAAGRGVPIWPNGKWGVDWDRPDDPIVQHFTPRNSWGFKGNRTYAQQPHGWRVKFINALNGYTEDERIVYDDGFDATNATLFEGIEFPGVTDPALIWMHGRFTIADARLRPEKITLQTGWENIVCTRGDRVGVAHDALLIGLGSGRVKSVAGQVVTVDEQLLLEDGKTYGMVFRVADDARLVTLPIESVDLTGKIVTLIGDLSLVKAGVLFSWGETDRVFAVYRVQAITHQKDLIATLTLVDDAPEISQADQGEIPAYDPNITIPPDPFSLPPRGLHLVEIVDGAGESVRDIAQLSWQLPRLGKVRSFEVQARDDDAAGRFVTVDTVPAPSMTADVTITSGGIWSFQVRCLFEDGTASTWTQLIGVTLKGLTFPPGDVTNLHEHTVDGRTVLDWTIVADRRILFYEIRKGTSWDTGLVVGPDVAQPPWNTTGDGTYHVRAYVLGAFGTRIYSLEEASITVSDTIIERNIIESRDEQSTGWTGSLDGGVIDGSFIRTDTAHAISLPWAQEVIDELQLSGAHIAVYVSPTLVDIGIKNECRFWTLFEADGIKIGDDFLAQTDVLASSDILGAAPTRFIRAFPIWRFADSADRDVFAPSDIFAPTDVFTAGVTWGDWTDIASGTRVSRYFQPGYVLITDDEATNAVGTKFDWFVDVPDRNDSYTNLTVPDTGLALTFYKGGYDANPVPGTDALHFNGGPNGSTVPHIQCAIVNPTNGDQVKITSLTAAGCTVHVVNAGSNVTRAGVNIFAFGF